MSTSLIENAIRAAAVEIHGATAQKFFDRLTSRAAELLGADYVLIGRFADAEQSRVRTLSLWAKEAHAPTLIYDLKGAPCSVVIAEDCCCHASGVADRFPEDHLLAEMKIEGYIGIRLLDGGGNPIGILAALFEKPVEDVSTVREAFRILAPRASTELARFLAEEENRLTQARLEAFRDILVLAETLDERQIIQAAVEKATRLTRSEIGYFHFVDEAAGMIRLFTWTGNVMASCSAAKEGDYPIEKAGVWADCLRTKRPVVHNDYQSIPMKKTGDSILVSEAETSILSPVFRKGYPEGHSHVTRHMSVPVIDGASVRMILGVGNKETPYDALDVRQLEHFASDVWLLIRRRRAEARLARREAFAQLTSDFSIRFIDLAVTDHDALHDLLAGLGRLLEADRSYLFLFDRAGATVSNTHEWCAPGIEAQRSRLQKLPLDAIPWWMARIRRFQEIEIPQVKDLPEEASVERRILREQGIRSVLVLPISWGGAARGFIGLDAVRSERTWSVEEKHEFRSVAEVCGLVIERIDAKTRLDEHLTFLQTLLDTIPAPVFSKDRDGRYTGCNRAFEEFLDRPVQEIIGRTVHEIAPNELARTYHEADLALMKQGGTQTYEAKVRAKNGVEKDVIFHKGVIADRSGRPDGIIGVITEITERKRLETELMKLTRAVEQSQATIVITDLEGRIEYANPAASRTTGYSFEELRGQNPRVLKGGNLPKEAYTALWETITRGETWSGEFLNKRKDGTLFWERAVISPVRDDEGRTIRYVAVKENITAQKEAEAELRDSRDFLDKILQSTANGIFVLDTEGRFSSVNDAAARITGRPREELLGRHFGFLIAEDFRPDCDNFFHDVVKNGLARRDFEVEILLPDGVRRPLSVSAAPLATNGLLVGLVGSAEDITDRQRAVEERFSSMEKEAMLGRLAAVVAHEVNNPLFAIKMQASSLARAIDGMEKESGRVKLILDQVDRIGRTVKALLGLARRHSTGFVELDLREMINSVLLLYEVGFVSKGIALDLDLPEDLPTVRAVPDRFQEVLVNLLENARQAIGANGRIGLRAIADEKEIELIIEDTGPGFGEKLDLIFKTRFTTKKEGTGLGLSIARRIVGEHGGTIVAENRAEGGARFRVRLPRFGG